MARRKLEVDKRFYIDSYVTPFWIQRYENLLDANPKRYENLSDPRRNGGKAPIEPLTAK